jgi:hypothetical protein
MVPRVRLVVGMIAFVLCLPAASLAQSVAITPGTPAYTNVQNAIKIIRDHGSTAAADEIQKRLDEGKIYVDHGMDEDDNAATSNVTKSIELNPAMVFPERALSPNGNFSQLVELARTLFHENIHSNHQGYWYNTAIGLSASESEAYVYTMIEMEKWISAERDKYFDMIYRPLKPMDPNDQLRELNHINTKITVLNDYPPKFAYKYFNDSDKTYISGAHTYWDGVKKSYSDPEATKVSNQLAPQPDPTPQVGGGTPATPTTPGTKPEPQTEEPPPAPEPEVTVTVTTCAPCQKIADQIRDVKERLKTLNDNAAKAGEAVKQNQQRIANLQKRVANLQAELSRAAGTGGSSYDPATGQTVDAYDQGNGTVKVTTKDAAGNVIEEHVRDSSARKADLNRQITEANAEIAKAQAEGKRLETAAATATKLVNDMATLLDQLVKELEDCIKKYCSNVSTSDALNMLNLPYDSLDVLRDPTSYNPFDGNTNGAFQQMIIEIRVGNAPGMTVPRGDGAPRNGLLQDVRQPRTMLAALLSWLRPTASAWMTGARRWSVEPRRPWSIDDAGVQARPGRSPFKQPVQMLLTSLGQSTGQAFDLQVFNGSGNSFKLAAQSLVVEPLRDEVKQQVQRGMQQLIRSTANPVTAKINGYCLEMLKLPPAAGTIFKIASPQLQQRFAPMRKIMDASRRVQRLGQLRPDSNPDGYFNAIRQWSMWTVQEKLNEKTFSNAFVEHTKKLVTGQKQAWTKDAEETIKKAAPNRWNDIQKVLAAAGVPLPR